VGGRLGYKSRGGGFTSCIVLCWTHSAVWIGTIGHELISTVAVYESWGVEFGIRQRGLVRHKKSVN